MVKSGGKGVTESEVTLITEFGRLRGKKLRGGRFGIHSKCGQKLQDLSHQTYIKTFVQEARGEEASN